MMAWTGRQAWTATVFASVAVNLWNGIDAVPACAQCASDMTCILDKPAEVFQPGTDRMKMTLCNYKPAKQYDLSFQFTTEPRCGKWSEWSPQVKKIHGEGCTGVECAVEVELENPIDWVLSTLPTSTANVVKAKISGNGGDNVLTEIGALNQVKPTLHASPEIEVATCSSSFTIKGQHFSSIPSCNKLKVCRSADGSPACLDANPLNAMISNVQCQGSNCSGEGQLENGLPCDESAGSNTGVVFSRLQVDESESTPPSNLGKLAAPAFEVKDVNQLFAGSTEITLEVTGACALNPVEVSIPGISVASSKVEKNDSIRVVLDESLDASQSGKELTFSFSQCGITSSDFTKSVSDEQSDDETADSSQDGEDGGSNRPPRNNTQTSPSTQTTNGSVGLPGAMIIGVIVAVMAMFGFVFECVHHKKRHERRSAGPAQSEADII